ncbi:hypothetical protein ABW21_db0200587 [Orbilia brochopaga]|nr:hypothetical protein ABW21_db0200587 [Drechslerella brochopaga]
METIQQLEQALIDRRDMGKHLRDHKSNERLDVNEVRKTNLKETYKYDLVEHSKDIQYTRLWFNIYEVFRRQGVIPSRVILGVLVTKAQDRMDVLGDFLDAVYNEEHHPVLKIPVREQRAIDMKRWKYKYYQQTLQDAETLLRILDQRDLNLYDAGYPLRDAYDYSEAGYPRRNARDYSELDDDL